MYTNCRWDQSKYLCNSDNIVNGCLGYLLADRGYDVWLGNARGNQYSRGHISHGTDTKEYWMFRFET